jgi:hypothetical protein
MTWYGSTSTASSSGSASVPSTIVVDERLEVLEGERA